MKTGLLLDRDFCGHDTGDHHPEAPGRILSIIEALTASGLETKCTPISPREVTDDEIRLVHSDGYLQKVLTEIDGSGSGQLSTGDTHYGPDSLRVARLATGGLLNAVDGVIEGTFANAFCAVRPPGHHATADRGMGFCIFNNAAIAARYAQQKHGLGRVVIIDWDVHHGNGTQALFYDDPSALFISIHQDGLYPEDLGFIEERGNGDGVGANINVPLPAGTGDAGYIAAIEQVVLPALDRFGPELIVLSSGQDAGACDPLGRMSVTTEGFRGMTSRLAAFADDRCEGRLVAVQEGGYSVDHMPFCVLATVEALAGFAPALPADPIEMDVPTRIKPIEIEAIRTAAAAAGLP